MKEFADDLNKLVVCINEPELSFILVEGSESRGHLPFGVRRKVKCEVGRLFSEGG
jgi:hypothetical protein